MKVLSPITNAVCSKVETIPARVITDRYRDLLAIDVSSYFEGINEIDIYQCPDTEFRFYYPFTPGNDRFYEELQKNPDYYSSTWKWDNRMADRFIENNTAVLDIGCGDGLFLEQIRNNRNCSIMGIEFNNLAMEKCRSKKIPVTSQSIEQLATDKKDSFDTVTAFQVLEHITDISSFVKSAIAVAKPGGKIIFAVPNNMPYLFNYDLFHTLNLPPHHAGLWNKKSLKGLADFFKLTVVDIIEQPGDKDLNYAPVSRMFYHNYISYLRHTHQKRRLFWLDNIFGKIAINAWITVFRKKPVGHGVVAVFRKDPLQRT